MVFWPAASQATDSATCSLFTEMNSAASAKDFTTKDVSHVEPSLSPGPAKTVYNCVYVHRIITKDVPHLDPSLSLVLARTVNNYI